MIDYHDHPVYAESRDVDSLRYDLEQRVGDARNDCRSERRETRQELLDEIQGLREYVDEVVAELAELHDLTKRVEQLEQKLPTVYEVHDLAGRIDAVERGFNATGGV